MLSALEVRNILAVNGVVATEGQWHVLETWVTALQALNQHINLVSRKETELLWEKHILPCLALLAVRDIPEGSAVCDFGTGGGLPGIPLAIIRPDLQVTLLDSTQKKIKALEQTLAPLSLPNVQTVCGRGEELGRQAAWRQRFSVITARAVASLAQLAQWTQDLRTAASVLHVFKGGDLRAEIRAAEKLDAILKIEASLLTLQDYTQLAEDEKTIVTLYLL